MREAVAVVLVACAALLIVGQWVAIARARRRRTYSAIPFLGAVLGSSGALVSGWPHAAWSIPAFIISDPGCIALIRLGARRVFR